eukprot:40789-Rhodomonas_salina.1
MKKEECLYSARGGSARISAYAIGQYRTSHSKCVASYAIGQQWILYSQYRTSHSKCVASYAVGQYRTFHSKCVASYAIGQYRTFHSKCAAAYARPVLDVMQQVCSILHQFSTAHPMANV